MALFVAVGQTGTLATSPDGLTWTQRSPGFGTDTIRDVVWSPDLGLFVAGGQSGKLATSPNGVNWTQRTSGFSSDVIAGVAWSPALGLFVIVGTSGKLATSPDGTTWTSRTSSFSSSFLTSVAWSPALDLFVAVGQSGKLASSPDGINWTQRTSSFSTTTINAVAWSPDLDLFVAVGESGKLATSPDGTTWTSRTSSFSTTTIEAVTWSPSLTLFVAVGWSGKLATSPDGTTWTQRTSGFVSSIIYGAAWSPELALFVIVGVDGKLRTSTDGTTWTSRTSSFGSTTIEAVAHGVVPLQPWLTLRWNVEKVRPTLTARWQVRNHVRGTLTARWQVRKQVQVTLTARWRVGKPGAFFVTIDGSTRSIIPDTLSVPITLGERGTASFTALTAAGIHLEKGMPVTIEDSNANVYFSGFVDRAVERPIVRGGTLEHRVSCVGFTYLTDKRLVAASYVEETAGTIVADIITEVLAAEGITAGTIDAGPTVTAAVFPYISATSALDRVATAAGGFLWWVDHDYALHFRDPASVAAPWEITDADVRARTVKVEHAGREYRNRQYVSGTDVTDPQTETRTGDDETRAWTVAYPIHEVPTITVDAVAKTVGILGVEEGKDFYWNKGSNTVSQDAGATALSPSDNLEIVYVGQYPILTLSEDPAAIADLAATEGVGSGMVERLAPADASITSRQAALEAGRAALADHARPSRTLSFTTHRTGLAVGQVATVTIPDHDLNGTTMLIRSVEMAATNNLLFWQVTAVEGPAPTTWARFLARSSGEVELLDFSQTALAILTLTSETGTWGETTDQTAWACSVPSTTLYPSTELYPC